MKIIKKFTIVILLVVSICLTGFANNPASINISAGAYCGLWGNVVMTLGGNLNNSGTFAATIEASGTPIVNFSGNTREYIGGTGSTQFRNAVLNNNTGNAQLTGSINVDGTLTLFSGTLNLKTYNLTLGGTATIVGSLGTIAGPFGTNSMIIADNTSTTNPAQLMKTYDAGATNFTFPIGDTTVTTDYSPVELNFTANSTQRIIGVNVTDQKDPNDLSTNNYISRYWNFTDNLCIGNYTYNATFTYSQNSPTDLVGTYNIPNIFWWNGSWNNLVTAYPGAPSYSVNNVTETTGSLCGTQFTALSCSVPVFSQQPQPVSPQCSPVSASFTVAASGDAPVSYQWQVYNGTSWNNISDGGSTPDYSGTQSAQLNITNAITTLQYRCIAATCSNTNMSSNAVTLTVNTAPVITFITPPRIKCSRDSVEFKVIATGTTPSYQWAYKGKNISKATTSSYSIGLITVLNIGTYSCTVTNICGSTSANTSLSINTPPSVQNTIGNQTKCAGSNESFTVISGGTNLDYQWSDNGIPIAGATNSTYTINSLNISNAGTYTCTVSNNCGTDALPPFSLTVNQKASINIIPPIINKNQGANLVFSGLSPSGTPPFSYQWLQNNNDISGATTNSLTIYSISCSEGGVYSAVITNTCGSTTAEIATVKVNGCSTYTISGIVIYDNIANTPITNTVVYLVNTLGTNVDTTTTDATTGAYTFTNVSNGIYNLVCGKPPMAWGGSDPTDALLVNRYFVGLIRTFLIGGVGDNALRKRCADVNNDSEINPTDALWINRRYVGIINKFSIPDWLYDSPTVIINNASASQNINANCAGDVNSSY